MRTLTVEELKALPSGEWVYVHHLSEGVYEGYLRKYISSQIGIIDVANDRQLTWDLPYDTYGIDWEAYKHKEDIKEPDYKKAFELLLEDVYNTRLQADTMSCSSCPFMEEIFDECLNQGLYEDCKKRWEEYYFKKAEE